MPKKKYAFLLLALVLAVVAVFIWKARFPSPFIVTSDQAKASRDQIQLINKFGYPDTFTLAMDGKDRLEVWNYYGLERSFTFKKGVFINDQIIDPLESFNAYPRLRPTQFKKGLTLEEVNTIIDSQPTSQADIIPEIMESSAVYNYFDQVIVGVQENKVVFVQTLPVKIKQEEK